jgi:hypothetical protein
MRIADIDNDSEKELIVSDYYDLIAFDAKDFSYEFSLDLWEHDFEVGNIDEDPYNELVVPDGVAYEIIGDNIRTEYQFSADAREIELVDINKDDKLEAIVLNYWDSIQAYDVVKDSIFYTIRNGRETLYKLELIDIDGDGVEEILFNIDNFFRTLACYNSLNGEKLWINTFPKDPDFGYDNTLGGVASGDFDGDKRLELAWSDCNNLGLFIIEPFANQYEWNNPQVSGPFRAVEIADIDNDSEDEIIAFSASSHRGQADSELRVYDARTKTIEFDSKNSDSLSLGHDIYNVEIIDYANDGDLDIIIAHKDEIGPKIQIIDGSTMMPEIEHTYSDSTGNEMFYLLEIADIDKDDSLEFIVASNNYIYLIDAINFEIKWKSKQTEIPRHWYEDQVRALKHGDLDGDGEQEIVLCKHDLFIIDDFKMSKTARNFYTAIELYDWDKDGDLEIIAGTTEGKIYVINALPFQHIDTIHINIPSSKRINSISFNEESEEDELIIVVDERVYFYRFNGQYNYTEFSGSSAGQYDGLAIADYDNDQNFELLVGTSYRLMEINASCRECLDNDIQFELIKPHCEVNDGIIIGKTDDPSISFSIDSIVFKDSLYNAGQGNYDFISTSSRTCLVHHLIELKAKPIEIDLNILDSSTSKDIHVYVKADGGTWPYEYSWYDRDTFISGKQNIFTLAPGSYFLIVKDLNNCTKYSNIDLFPTSIIQPFPNDISLYPNPTSGKLYIQNNNNTRIGHIEVYSLAGRKVEFTQREEGMQYIVNLENEVAGSYIIVLHINGQLYYKKVILAP